ncbi:glycosyltransferase family 4 protein [Paraburkholderia diazotrophica]|uniref:glycosyltransferase family 4 protein n=1 Tax=Paraburkholderia diazotrophica TaxID=667676 RepID=UPI003174B992
MSMPAGARTVGFLLRAMYCNDGVSSHVETLIRALAANGWKVVVISGHVHYDAQSKMRYDRIRSMVAHWEIIDGLNTMLPSPAHIARCYRVIRAFDIAILHGHGFSSLPCAALLRLLTGAQCLATFHPSIHSSQPHEIASQARRRQQSVKYRLLLSATRPFALIATSLEISDWLRDDVGISSRKVMHIPLGIDSDTYRLPTPDERLAARSALRFADDECILLLAGRLSWNKGHDLLIDAARSLKSRRPDAKFRVVFVGSGDQESEIRQYALRHADTAHLFTFMGFVEDLAGVYWASDVFVLPSRYEGFGLVVAEAMCAGLLPVRTPSGGARDQIVDGESGFITPFDDPESLGRILEPLVCDARLRERASAVAALRGRALFSQEGMAQKTAALYERHLKSV